MIKKHLSARITAVILVKLYTHIATNKGMYVVVTADGMAYQAK